jgi:hypothetical protein
MGLLLQQQQSHQQSRTQNLAQQQQYHQQQQQPRASHGSQVDAGDAPPLLQQQSHQQSRTQNLAQQQQYHQQLPRASHGSQVDIGIDDEWDCIDRQEQSCLHDQSDSCSFTDLSQFNDIQNGDFDVLCDSEDGANCKVHFCTATEATPSFTVGSSIAALDDKTSADVSSADQTSSTVLRSTFQSPSLNASSTPSIDTLSQPIGGPNNLMGVKRFKDFTRVGHEARAVKDQVEGLQIFSQATMANAIDAAVKTATVILQAKIDELQTAYSMLNEQIDHLKCLPAQTAELSSSFNELQKNVMAIQPSFDANTHFTPFIDYDENVYEGIFIYVFNETLMVTHRHRM